MKRMRNLKGFTLIELIVVILILGILAAIAVVGYTQITDRANETAGLANAKQVATDLSAKATLAQADDSTTVAGDEFLATNYPSVTFLDSDATDGSISVNVGDGTKEVKIDVSDAIAVAATAASAVTP